MTPQETFDTVVRHLHQHGRRAYRLNLSGRKICQLRTDDGLKCAIGCLIPDEEYDERMEHMGEEYRGFVEKSRLSNYLLFALREIHDTPIYWGPAGLNCLGVDELRYTAMQHNISSAVLAEYFPNP